MIYGGSGTSRPQRILVQGIQTLLFATGVVLTLRANGMAARQWILIAAFAVVYLRMTLTMFHLLRRAIGWGEAVTIPVAFGLYYVGFALLGGGRSQYVGALDIAGAALFITGSGVNTTSEWLRHWWKSDPANQGKLYTGGLFRLAVHVNYFGDVLWVLGLALMTANPWALLIPALLFCFFALYNGPMLDRHLAEKYGEAFRRYAD